MSLLSSNSIDAELIQYLFPAGWGPSSKTWPRCAPQLLHWSSILCIPQALSITNFKFCILAAGPETRTAGPGIKLCFRVKELITTADATVSTIFFAVPILACERQVSTFHSADLILLRGKLFFPHFFILPIVNGASSTFYHTTHQNRIILIDIRGYFQIRSRFI
jgi:hypothetical protein